MSNIRTAKVTAKYPMFGDIKPEEFIKQRILQAKDNGFLESARVLDISESTHGIQNITFIFTCSLDVVGPISSTFDDAKALADLIVRDTDTEILNVELI